LLFDHEEGAMTWEELLSRLSQDQLVVVVFMLCGFLVAAIAVVAHHWQKVRLAQVEAALKQHMLDKGMSAPEIEKVLKASSAHEEETQEEVPFTGNPADDKAKLLRILLDNSYSGNDIERLLRAAYGPSSSAPASPEPNPKTAAQKATILKMLAENELPVEEIEKVLLAFDGSPSARESQAQIDPSPGHPEPLNLRSR
jgi:hypothetical protein